MHIIFFCYFCKIMLSSRKVCRHVHIVQYRNSKRRSKPPSVRFISETFLEAKSSKTVAPARSVADKNKFMEYHIVEFIFNWWNSFTDETECSFPKGLISHDVLMALIQGGEPAPKSYLIAFTGMKVLQN